MNLGLKRMETRKQKQHLRVVRTGRNMGEIWRKRWKERGCQGRGRKESKRYGKQEVETPIPPSPYPPISLSPYPPISYPGHAQQKGTLLYFHRGDLHRLQCLTLLVEAQKNEQQNNRPRHKKQWSSRLFGSSENRAYKRCRPSAFILNVVRIWITS